MTVPLIVDVDGTLLRTDLLHEAALQFVARHPFQAWRLPVWTLSGKARLKTMLAERVDCGVETLPLRDEVVALIRAAQAEGRPVYLASASARPYVEALAARLGGIHGIFATEGSENLAGAGKAERLAEAFGEGGYDYVGNCGTDFPVWRTARTALVVANRKRFESRVKRAFPDAQFVARHRADPRQYYRALRVHQWAKNLLIFLPLIAGHDFDAASLGRTLLGFLCFCAAASSAYIINDLLDLPSDRDHARKRNRPFASGAIPVAHGPPMAALLLAAALGGALLLPPWFFVVLLLYVSLTLAYSLFLKRRVLIDVITLGGLYTLRVLAGVAAVEVETSPWLLMFSLFIFLSLAIVKRCSELVAGRVAGRTSTSGRGYLVDDLRALLSLGAAAGYGAVLIVSLYIASPEVQELYRHPQRLWLICPLLLYWVSRVLLLSNRGALHDDPVIFALTDRVSWVVGICAAAAVTIAI